MVRSSLAALALVSIPFLLTAAGRSVAKLTAPAAATNHKVAPATPASQETKRQAASHLASLPVYFEPNRGQSDPSVSYLARMGSTRLFLTRDSAVFVLRNQKPATSVPAKALPHPPTPLDISRQPAEADSSVVRMRMVNSQRSEDEAIEPLPGVSNYFIGNDSSKWVTGVPQFAKVKRPSVYPGIDMVFYGNQRQFEYDFVVAPGADPNRIELAFDGVSGIRTTASGDLVLSTAAGDFIQKKPKVYQMFQGKQVEVASHYRIGTGKSVRFEVAAYDRKQSLVIDPYIVFNAIVGATADDFAVGAAVDTNFNTYVLATSSGPDFPLASAYDSTFPSSNRMAVVKLNAAGTALLYSTYLGGESNDYAAGIAVDTDGTALIAGTTTSSQYPTVSAAQSTFAGNYDGVVTKLSANGGSLQFSTYLGGSGGDQLEYIAVDGSGNSYVAGQSNGGFPVTNGVFQGAYGTGVTDCIVSKFTRLGAIVYSAYLGGSDQDVCYAIAPDSSGNAFVTGYTQSSNFPTTSGALQGTYGGGGDSFISKIKADGTTLLFSTYFGGSGTENALGIAVDTQNAAYIAGSTNSSNLRVSPNAYQTAFKSSAAAYVTKVSSTGVLSYSTYISGTKSDGGYSIAVDTSFNAYIAGVTNSSDFPVSGAVIATKPGAATDFVGFATSLNSTGTGLQYSTFIGGPGASSRQYARTIAVDTSGNAYVVGQTDSPNYRNTTGALNSGFGGADLFVTKIASGFSGCTLSFGTPTLNPYGSGGTYDIEIFAPSNCTWSANPNANWIGMSGIVSNVTGSTSTTITIAANPGAARSSTIGFTSGQGIAINQGPNGCTYGFTTTATSVPTGGGSGSASVTAGSGCTWNAVSNEPWLTFTTGSGSGAGTLGFTAVANNGLAARSATITVGTATFTVTQASASGATYAGNLESTTCAGFSGWAADKNRLNTSIAVTLWDGSTQIATTTANASRPDVGAVIGDNGLHGFSMTIPAAYLDGKAHTLQVRYETSSTQLPNSPVAINCGSSNSPTYIGYVESATCSGISGWAADKNRLNTPITVTLWDNGTQVALVTANATRSDVGASLGDNGQHGFSIPIPTGVANGVAHTLQVRFETSTTQLVGSPFTLTCGSTGGSTNYAGYVDTANCNGISGWALDKNRLNTSIVVTLWDGSTQVASVTANASRSDVGNLVGDNGLHGFSIPIPSSVANGAAHTLQVRFETGTTQLPGSPVTLTCGGTGGTNYVGYVDTATCSGISGWAADKNRLNTSIVVTLWDGGTQVASVTANGSRSDVGNLLGDNGLHAFSIPIPSSVANGAAHTLQIRYETSASQLPGSPVTLTCGGTGGTNYVGYVDTATCSGISGWAADKNRLNTSIVVTLWDGGTQVASVTANGSRSDVGNLLGDNGLHAFSIPIPSSVANGAAHTLQIRYETSASQLPGSPVTLTCGGTGGTNYVGYVDTASCSGINGWAADKNRLNTSIVVTLWDGSTQVASVTANGSRSDVGALLGDNGLHAFSIPIPSSVANGAAHTLQIRYETSASQLPGSPVTLTCGSGGGGSPNYTGWVDTLGCSALSGWAADKNALNTSLTVQFFDGATLLGSTIANAGRSDVGTLLGDNGLHGFTVATPTALKDGATHTVTFRPVGSSFVIPGATTTLTGCH